MRMWWKNIEYEWHVGSKDREADCKHHTNSECFRNHENHFCIPFLSIMETWHLDSVYELFCLQLFLWNAVWVSMKTWWKLHRNRTIVLVKYFGLHVTWIIILLFIVLSSELFQRNQIWFVHCLMCQNYRWQRGQQKPDQIIQHILPYLHRTHSQITR